ncbi:MAG: aminopeptidase [Steroidobacteraceae bacterium]|jgi:predicted aminopeptidase
MLTETRTRPGRASPIALSLLLCGALSGCGVAYMTQAAQGQLSLMRARRAIPAVLADPGTSPELRTRLQLVQDARAFASSALLLPDNRSYRSYSDLHRPYAVWNVVAAPEFSIEPRHWCFPFTGCIAYRGYFHERSARRYARSLAARGNDVLVYGVAAYSTLGHFADPVLNTMMEYGDLELVSTLFHELAHQLVYVSGDSEFNESFAVTVEREGLRRWLAARDRSAELAEYLERRQALEQIDGVFTAGRAQLGRLYGKSLSSARMRERKRARLETIAQNVRALEQQYGLHTIYDEWIAQGLNNAHLASIATYTGCVPGFQRLLAAQAGALPAFYSAVRELARDSQARRALCHDHALNVSGEAQGAATEASRP